MPSIFSKIINREIPAHIVYEDEHVIAFLDIQPVSPGHTLVVPKQESVNALEATLEDLAHVLRVVQQLAPRIVKTVGAQGCNITTNIGEAAGQSVFHTHFHIIPRFSEDNLSSWPKMSVTQDELAQMAERIREHLLTI